MTVCYFFIESSLLTFLGSIEVLYDIEINTEKAKIDVQEAQEAKAKNNGTQNANATATPDYGDYNLDNLDEFLSKPAILVKKVLMDNKVQEDIDQQLAAIAEIENRTTIGTLKKNFEPVVDAFFDGGKNFEIYCRDNCLENEILIHPR